MLKQREVGGEGAIKYAISSGGVAGRGDCVNGGGGGRIGGGGGCRGSGCGRGVGNATHTDTCIAPALPPVCIA